MCTRWFEPFTLLIAAEAPDGLGGSTLTLTPDVSFQGALTHTTTAADETAGQLVLHAEPHLLHEFDVTLHPGDYVRRNRDGTVYRVRGFSDGMRTPAFSGLQFAQVPVERWVRA